MNPLNRRIITVACCLLFASLPTAIAGAAPELVTNGDFSSGAGVRGGSPVSWKHLAGLVKFHDSIAKSLVDHGPTTRRPLRMDADSVALPLSQLKL
jgi:hypothetical protein